MIRKIILMLDLLKHLGISHLTGKALEYKPFAVSDHLLLHNHD